MVVEDGRCRRAEAIGEESRGRSHRRGRMGRVFPLTRDGSHISGGPCLNPVHSMIGLLVAWLVRPCTTWYYT
jgi:hypothetical protein